MQMGHHPVPSHLWRVTGVRPMPPLIFVDSRECLPREAVTTINLSAKRNSVWLIKPLDPGADASLDTSVSVVDPREINGAVAMIREFRSVYTHLSTNSVAYERSCFERFILLNCWAAESGVQSAWHFDTDAWATRDLSALTPPGFAYNMVAGLPTGLEGPHPSVTVSQSYVTSDVLRRFTEFLLQDFFVTWRQELQAWFTHRRELSQLGGVSDMMAWGAFLKDSPDVTVWNSFSSTISGYLLIDTLYQLVEQLRAQGWVLSGRGMLLIPSPDGLSLMVGPTKIEVAGVHLAGADKPLVFSLASGRQVPYMGMNQRFVRVKHRIRRRAKRIWDRA